MVLSPTELQKKRQKKQQKRSVKVKAKTVETTIISNLLAKQQILHVGNIHDAWVSSSLEESGIGDVIMSRKSNHQIILVDFLIDVYCLGVKNVLMRQKTLDNYPDFINMISKPIQPIDSYRTSLC